MLEEENLTAIQKVHFLVKKKGALLKVTKDGVYL